MSYSMLNKELRIQSCSITDLNPADFAEPLEDPETISIIYNPLKDTVILNNNHEDYEFYKVLVDSYLAVDGDKQSKMKEHTRNFSKNGFEETFCLLDQIYKTRKRIK